MADIDFLLWLDKKLDYYFLKTNYVKKYLIK